MAGRMYAVGFDGLSVTNDSSQDIFEMVANAAVPFLLHSFELYSATTTDDDVSSTSTMRSAHTAARGHSDAMNDAMSTDIRIWAR